MPTTTYPLDPPVDAGLVCRNCSDPIVATASVYRGGYTISGLREFVWVHAHGSKVCRPTTVAQPYDGWFATTKVEAAMAERREAEDAAMDAEVEGGEVIQPEGAEEAPAAAVDLMAALKASLVRARAARHLPSAKDAALDAEEAAK